MSDDTIYRQAAIDEIARWIGYIDEDMILRIQTGLKKVPSAQPEKCEDCGNFNKARLLIPQPERKKGHWIVINNESAGVYECDQCHERVCCVGKYCMHCGSPMEVQE